MSGREAGANGHGATWGRVQNARHEQPRSGCEWARRNVGKGAERPT